MSRQDSCEVAVIGGGIIGLAVAGALPRRRRESLIVLEAERRLATGQTGHSSGVIHSGLYYKPGSNKARCCTAGREELYTFCRENEIPHERCGKLVVATRPEESAALQELERRGRANGLDGMRRLGPDEIAELEPHVRALEALWVPQTGIVDFTEVARAMAQKLREDGVRIRTTARVSRVLRRADGFVLQSSAGDLEARNLINCAGLQSDRIARLCGVEPGLRIVPFRGEYYKLLPHREHLVRNLIYPVPDLRLPFLGPHFTRSVHGGISAGPDAVPALAREGYARWSFSPTDALGLVTYTGFWRLAARHWKAGAAEIYRSLRKKAFARDLQKMIPELTSADIRRDGAGVRAQAVTPDGTLIDDFHLLKAERMLHVLNAPSPAATASLAIGRTLAATAEEVFG